MELTTHMLLLIAYKMPFTNHMLLLTTHYSLVVARVLGFPRYFLNMFIF